MKRQRVFVNAKALTLAMLVIVLAFGMTFLGCSSDIGAPKTIVGLFNEVKDFNVGYLWALNDDNTTQIYWCYTHKAWEPWEDGVGLVHGGTPAFDIKDAVRLIGNYIATQNDANAAVARDVIKKLDSFYEDQYKLDLSFDIYTESAGTEFIVWYYFNLAKNGFSSYGSSAAPAVAPFKGYYYMF